MLDVLRQSVLIRRQATSAESSISQDSNSMALDNSIDTTITHIPATGYEQVSFTDSGKLIDASFFCFTIPYMYYCILTLRAILSMEAKILKCFDRWRKARI